MFTQVAAGCQLGGEGSASRPGRSLPPEKTRYPLYGRLGGPQDRSGEVRKISPPPGFDPRIVQPVASHYTDWATLPTIKILPEQILHILKRPVGTLSLQQHYLVMASRVPFSSRKKWLYNADNSYTRSLLEIQNVFLPPSAWLVPLPSSKW